VVGSSSARSLVHGWSSDRLLKLGGRAKDSARVFPLLGDAFTYGLEFCEPKMIPLSATTITGHVRRRTIFLTSPYLRTPGPFADPWIFSIKMGVWQNRGEFCEPYHEFDKPRNFVKRPPLEQSEGVSPRA
jgi:hypothetical protein